MADEPAAKRSRIADAPLRRYMLAGSGKDFFADPRAAEKVMSMIPPSRMETLRSLGTKPLVVYFGTATYDSVEARRNQADHFMGLGCEVNMLCCTRGTLADVKVYEVLGAAKEPVAEAHSAAQESFSTITPEQDPTMRHKAELHTNGGAGSIQELIAKKVDVLLVSGGNTLYAVDKWTELGFSPLLKEAEARGAVLCGGSAGAICWFDAGHSDSGDPTTWLSTLDKRYVIKDENENKSWKYIRCPGLGFMPGLLVPHGDKTQSNGVLRADDFDTMLRRLRQEDSGNERGVHIDHWAALSITGDDYEVYVLDGKEGSLLPNGDFSRERAGAPAIWTKELVEGPGDELTVERKLAPIKGRLMDLLVEGRSQGKDEENVAACRKNNPAV